jgi:hypothetical protein
VREFCTNRLVLPVFPVDKGFVYYADKTDFMMKHKLYRDLDTGKSFTDRRLHSDRRNRFSVFPLSYLGPLRRKKAGRREGDIGYVDVYGFRTWVMAVSLILLSLMDAVLTQQHLLVGSAREANPFMEILIRRGGMPVFYGAKIVLTLVAVGIIMLHKEWALGRYAARFCLWIYILLSLYHIYLATIVRRAIV